MASMFDACCVQQRDVGAGVNAEVIHMNSSTPQKPLNAGAPAPRMLNPRTTPRVTTPTRRFHLSSSSSSTPASMVPGQAQELSSARFHGHPSPRDSTAALSLQEPAEQPNEQAITLPVIAAQILQTRFCAILILCVVDLSFFFLLYYFKQGEGSGLRV